MTKKLLMTSALVASMSSAALAEGLERSNYSSFFLFEEGNYVEAAIGTVRPDLPASVPTAALGLPAGGTVPIANVAPEFNALNFAFKTDLSDQFSMGVSYTSQGNGVLINWAPAPISADVSST